MKPIKIMTKSQKSRFSAAKFVRGFDYKVYSIFQDDVDEHAYVRGDVRSDRS